MKVVAAYLLAVLGGNISPSADYLKHILGSVGAEAEDDKLSFFLGELEGKDINEVITLGREKFASVSGGGSGGGSVLVSAATGGGAAGGGSTAAAEVLKEEKKEEKKEAEEESDDDMGFSLFD